MPQSVSRGSPAPLQPIQESEKVPLLLDKVKSDAGGQCHGFLNDKNGRSLFAFGAVSSTGMTHGTARSPSLCPLYTSDFRFNSRSRHLLFYVCSILGYISKDKKKKYTVEVWWFILSGGAKSSTCCSLSVK